MNPAIAPSKSEIQKLLNSHNMFAATVDLLQDGAKNLSYKIDDRYLLKLSTSQFEDESLKYSRVGLVPHAATLKHTGFSESKSGLFYYMITDYLRGRDLYTDSSNLTCEQQAAVGVEISTFLSNLHSIKGPYFDVGHYVPTIPHHAGSWLEGHRSYIEYLRSGLASVDTKTGTTLTIEDSLLFIEENVGCLEYQQGPRLLHNDLHPKNIIVHDGRLSGVIDWECSQYGEPDFDLSHLIHWCILPPDAGVDMIPFLHSTLLQSRWIGDVPDISTRITIYQIEHELNQLIWNKGVGENERRLRIEVWLEGRVHTLFREFDSRRTKG